MMSGENQADTDRESLLRTFLSTFENQLVTDTPAERYVLGMMTTEDGRCKHGYTQNGTIGKTHHVIKGQSDAIESLANKGLMEAIGDGQYRVTESGLEERKLEEELFSLALGTARVAVHGQFGRGQVGFSIDSHTGDGES